MLFAGGVYECTTNDTNGRYCQSQFAFMLDLPSQEAVEKFEAIKVWIAPAGTQYISFDQNNMPTKTNYYLTTFPWGIFFGNFYSQPGR